jgi:hypothetical protein
MDTVTAAILAAFGKLGAKAVQDTYEGLKTVVRRKFGVESDLADAVEKLEKKPEAEGRQITLKEEVEAAGASKDAEIMKAVEALIEAIKEQPGGEEAVQQIINQQVIGDDNIFSGTGNISVTR